LGILSIASANKLAEEAELDLVDGMRTTKPPVCRASSRGSM